MVALPLPSKPTVDAIYASYEAAQDTGYRDHLGASVIGEPCSRALWFSFRWATRARHAGRLLRLFETGHMSEERFVDNLRRVGVKVLDVDPDTGGQWTVRDSTGHFGGSMDGVGLGLLEAPKTWHLLEFKTHNTKSFAKLVSDGVQASKPRHFAQMQVYMHLAGLDRAFYLAVNKDTDELHSERVHYDVAAAVRLVAKAQSIIASPTPPEGVSRDPAWYECRFCDHQEVCHRGARPEAHCRSCLHSTPIENGAWQCARWDWDIKPSEQREGCYAHLFIPQLHGGEQVDAGDDWVDYRMPDGSVQRDGVPF